MLGPFFRRMSSQSRDVVGGSAKDAATPPSGGSGCRAADHRWLTSAITRLISGRQEPQFVPACSRSPTASTLRHPHALPRRSHRCVLRNTNRPEPPRRPSPAGGRPARTDLRSSSPRTPCRGIPRSSLASAHRGGPARLARVPVSLLRRQSCENRPPPRRRSPPGPALRPDGSPAARATLRRPASRRRARPRRQGPRRASAAASPAVRCDGG